MHSSASLQTGESPEARPIPFFYKPGGKIILGQEADAQIANEVATWKTKAVRVIRSNRCLLIFWVIVLHTNTKEGQLPSLEAFKGDVNHEENAQK